MVKQYLFYLDPIPFISNTNLDSLMTEIQLKVDEIDSLEGSKNMSIVTKNKPIDSIRFYDFNPNGLSVEKWQEFGLTEKQSQVIKRYESSGGNFRTKKDVKKMFVISDLLYQKLEEHILLPDSMVYDHDKVKKKRLSEVSKAKIIIDINLADTSEFKKLYGIGSVLSKRIVEYRENLGGFYAKEQLNRVYGLKKEVLLRLDTQLVINSITLRKININTASVEELRSHPLISWKVANSIVKYRKQHGAYENLNALKKIVLITELLFEELSPYLEI